MTPARMTPAQKAGLIGLSVIVALAALGKCEWARPQQQPTPIVSSK